MLILINFLIFASVLLMNKIGSLLWILTDMQNQINETDKEIDKIVYELYELKPEEVEIVDDSVKLLKNK